MEVWKNKCSIDIEKNQNAIKSEWSAEMGGGSKIKDRQKKYDKELKAEISFWQTELPTDDNGKKKTFDWLSTKKKWDLLAVIDSHAARINSS